MNRDWIVLSVCVIKKVLSPLRRSLPFLELIRLEIERVKPHGRFSDTLAKIVKDTKSRRAESMNRDRIGIEKPHSYGGLCLTPSSVDLGNGDRGTGHNFLPNNPDG